ncbi:hypothetical protein GA0061105_12019 [Rhizobium aethiopicum]|uniref:Uncharacterized protein n=1 Tax=Rhizobium aethiopicum TaxID=1138170 RepID=A0A1C3YB05_9HYPH|nr:hypothetical protein GA0061105_12019 [Rhizobium aethiopicum]
MDKGLVTPHVVRQPDVEAAMLIRDEAFTQSDFSFDVAKTFASFIIEAQRTGSALKPLLFNVTQQVQNRR